MYDGGIVLILGSTGKIKPGEHRISILSTKGKIERVKSDCAFTIKLAKEVEDQFGVIDPVGSREYFSKNQFNDL